MLDRREDPRTRFQRRKGRPNVPLLSSRKPCRTQRDPLILLTEGITHHLQWPKEAETIPCSLPHGK